MRGTPVEKLKNYGLLVKYLVSTQWKKITGKGQQQG
jgi:hypothetical protein